MLNEPLHIAVLCSKRAPGLQNLLQHPEHGLLYSIDCLVTTEDSFQPSAVYEKGWSGGLDQDVPVISHPIRSFYRCWNAPLSDLGVRRQYDAATAKLLFPLRLDAIVLLGYLYRITEPLLVLYPDRILNVHDSDLPRYPGLHATRDAIVAGERETRSSVHIVTRELDAGPVIARSNPFPVASFASQAARAGDGDIVRAYAYAHRELMMRHSWADLVVSGLQALAVAQEVPA